MTAFTDYIKNNRKLMRKVFGEKEIEIILKQLKGENLTQSESNRLSRDIKAKLKLVEELSGFKREFELKKNQIAKNIIDDAVNQLMNDKDFNNIQAILLGGSYADNSYLNKSDIDIFVIFKDINTKEATIFRKRMLAKIDEKVDLQVFNTLPEKVKNSVVKKKKILFRRAGYNL